MIRYLSVSEVVALHTRVLASSGGSPGLRDPSLLDSAVHQPRTTFEGDDLYPSLTAKAAALAYSLVKNHPFVDGNKRIGHAAMEVFLILNGLEMDATIDEQERMFLDLAGGHVTRGDLSNWIAERAIDRRV